MADIKLQRYKISRRISWEEMDERMVKGLCMFCDELETPDHHLRHKKSGLLLLDCDDDQNCVEDDLVGSVVAIDSGSSIQLDLIPPEANDVATDPIVCGEANDAPVGSFDRDESVEPVIELSALLMPKGEETGESMVATTVEATDIGSSTVNEMGSSDMRDVRVADLIYTDASRTEIEAKPEVFHQLEALNTKVSNSLVDYLSAALRVDVGIIPMEERIYVLDVELVKKLSQQSMASTVELVAHQLVHLLFPRVYGLRKELKYQKSWKFKYKSRLEEVNGNYREVTHEMFSGGGGTVFCNVSLGVVSSVLSCVKSAGPAVLQACIYGRANHVWEPGGLVYHKTKKSWFMGVDTVQILMPCVLGITFDPGGRLLCTAGDELVFVLGQAACNETMLPYGSYHGIYLVIPSRSSLRSSLISRAAVYKRMLTYLLLMEVLIWKYGREQKKTSELMIQELLRGMFQQIFDDRLLWECSTEGKEKLRFRSQVSTSLDHHLIEEGDIVLLYIQRHLLRVQIQQKQNGKKCYKSRMFKYKQKISKTRAWTETQQLVVQGASMFITSGKAGTLQSRDCEGRREQGRSMKSKLLKNWKFKFKGRMLLLLEVYLQRYGLGTASSSIWHRWRYKFGIAGTLREFRDDELSGVNAWLFLVM